jgi:3'-5' exoribonuclease
MHHETMTQNYMRRKSMLKLIDYSNMLEDSSEKAISRNILFKSNFCEFPASNGKHHGHDGGLADHTLEVYEFSKALADLSKVPICPRQLYLAALFHDYGKLWDYKKNPDGTWKYTAHKRQIHHLNRSAAEWVRIANLYKLDESFIDEVFHAILAHHGRQDWGSPVTPNSPLAWTLHLGDMASAKINETAQGLDSDKLHERSI